MNAHHNIINKKLSKRVALKHTLPCVEQTASGTLLSSSGSSARGSDDPGVVGWEAQGGVYVCLQLSHTVVTITTLQSNCPPTKNKINCQNKCSSEEQELIHGKLVYRNPVEPAKAMFQVSFMVQKFLDHHSE